MGCAGLRGMLDVTPRYESCSREDGRARKKLGRFMEFSDGSSMITVHVLPTAARRNSSRLRLHLFQLREHNQRPSRKMAPTTLTVSAGISLSSSKLLSQGWRSYEQARRVQT